VFFRTRQGGARQARVRCLREVVSGTSWNTAHHDRPPPSRASRLLRARPREPHHYRSAAAAPHRTGHVPEPSPERCRADSTGAPESGGRRAHFLRPCQWIDTLSAAKPVAGAHVPLGRGHQLLLGEVVGPPGLIGGIAGGPTSSNEARGSWAPSMLSVWASAKAGSTSARSGRRPGAGPGDGRGWDRGSPGCRTLWRCQEGRQDVRQRSRRLQHGRVFVLPLGDGARQPKCSLQHGSLHPDHPQPRQRLQGLSSLLRAYSWPRWTIGLGRDRDGRCGRPSRCTPVVSAEPRTGPKPTSGRRATHTRPTSQQRLRCALLAICQRSPTGLAVAGLTARRAAVERGCRRHPFLSTPSLSPPHTEECPIHKLSDSTSETIMNRTRPNTPNNHPAEPTRAPSDLVNSDI